MTEEEARLRVASLVDAVALARLDRLTTLVLTENQRQNLIARSTEATIWRRHLLDSIQLLTLVERPSGIWLDIGTGGGFPGLAVACALDTPVVMVEPRQRRAGFLEQAVAELSLTNASVRAGKVEAISIAAQVISARAVAPVGRLLRAARGCASSATVWLLPRGSFPAQEHDALVQQQATMMFHVEQSLSSPEATILVARGVPR